MPAINEDLYYIGETQDGPKVFAKENIPKGTNLGPVFMITGSSGNYKEDFKRTRLGRYMRQNQFFYNLIIKPSRYKVYAIASRNIKQGEELIMNTFPWTLDFYMRKNRVQQRRS